MGLRIVSFKQWKIDLLSELIEIGEDVPCPHCEGDGRVSDDDEDGTDSFCDDCWGSGDVHPQEITLSEFFVDERQYKDEILEQVRQMSVYTGISFFELLCSIEDKTFWNIESINKYGYKVYYPRNK